MRLTPQQLLSVFPRGYKYHIFVWRCFDASICHYFGAEGEADSYRGAVFFSVNQGLNNKKGLYFWKWKKRTFVIDGGFIDKKTRGLNLASRNYRVFLNKKMKIFLYIKNGALFLHFIEIRVLFSFIRYGSLRASKVSSTCSILLKKARKETWFRKNCVP